MISKWIERASAYADRLSERERRLATAVMALLPLFIAMAAGRAAYSYVQAQDEKISALKAKVVGYKLDMARKQVVEDEYKKVAAQHSSTWPATVIQDRLRMELYRLASKLPPPLKADGTPTSTTSNDPSGRLVPDPELSAGNLREGGEGYKEFALSIHIQPVPFNNLIDYLERLQNSPQMLRIDTLLMNRNPSTNEVSADLDITRTVVTGSIEVPDIPEQEVTTLNAPPLQWTLEDWKVSGAAVAEAAAPFGTGKQTLEVVGSAPEGRVYLEQMMAAGAVYDMLIDLKCEGPCRLGIQESGAEEVFPGEKMLPANGAPYRYHVQFTVPGKAGSETQLLLPLITLETPGTKAQVENIVLERVKEAS